MIAAQYEITLPTDYDLGIIRRRVAERGSALDDRAGLGLKAYLVRDVADGSPVNAYAPFYLWNDPVALAAFHWGGQGFAGIVRDFGRPTVRTWIGGRFTRGDDIDAAPTHAVTQLGEAAATQHTHSVAWAVDPTRWDAVVLRLATAAPTTEPATGTVYRVEHLSAPGFTELGEPLRG